jgi:hypothetical protein
MASTGPVMPRRWLGFIELRIAAAGSMLTAVAPEPVDGEMWAVRPDSEAGGWHCAGPWAGSANPGPASNSMSQQTSFSMRGRLRCLPVPGGLCTDPTAWDAHGRDERQPAAG